ncbi:Macrolide export ATP-binding/permease protein MacB [subsurface metagenome]
MKNKSNFQTIIRQIILNTSVALDAIVLGKMRALLTSLGIIFGVASVIAMVAIGAGAKYEILAQMKLLGVNNIIIKPVVEQEEGEALTGTAQDQIKERRWSPGITLSDAKSIQDGIPYVEYVSPEVVFETMIVRAGLRRTGKLVGVGEHYYSNTDYELLEGNFFNRYQLDNSVPVCIIGHGISTKFFVEEDPIGKRIKCGNLWLTVIGVLEEWKITEANIEHLGLRDYNMDIYTPIKTVLLRYKNRGLLTRQDILSTARPGFFGHPGMGDFLQTTSQNVGQETIINYHQLDQLVIRVAQSEFITPVTEILTRILQRRHNGVVDYEVIVPEQLLKQEQETRRIFNMVLGAIASISLIVGGIGIMNIMLASVMERIREIGIRQALGANRRDIILQFLLEAITISVAGGILGIVLGILVSYGIEKATGIATIVTGIPIAIAFFVSITIGLVFGSYPAKRAAEQDPIVSLRHE